ncbi:MAG: hypothetical protein FD138_1794 [Planctomycetota bacterium]|nr:MAG: hypothetical protein FD138_1794 [Planctomycetota bacterium]
MKSMGTILTTMLPARTVIPMKPRCNWMTVVIATLFLSDLSLPAQDKPAAPVSESDEAKLSREQLQVSLEQVAPLRLQHAETGAEIERVAHPVLRFAAPLWGNHHGTVWVWGKRGRPVAVLEMCQQKDNGVWAQAFHATTDTPIKLPMPNGKTWVPKSSNLKFQPLSNAPRPADTPTARLRQMKALAQKFSAHQLWTWREGDGSRHELRLLTTPVHRYEDRDQQLIDGAIFVIAQGTNPEATLFLEAIHPANEAQPIWQFGIGRTSFAEQIVNYEDQEVYHDPPVKHAEIFNSTNSYWRTTATLPEKASQP